MRFVLFIFTILIAPTTFAQTAIDGYKAYDAGDYEKAKAIIPSLAEQGDPIAMNAMGKWHHEGIIVEKSRKKACDWLEKAAKAGYVPSQYNFANCFHELGGRKENIKEHLNWLTKAGEQSHLRAQLRLMFWYMDTNKKLAQLWGEKAAAQNNATARVSLWMSNLDDNIPPVKFSEIACVFFNNMILDKDWLTCDD
ncbi:tetratricopeptide repeat protein [Terasakiella sp. SH-1]|uniref:tetratricopeptide repeat protein n=1 Tax=Terasakiella sp. SH-1 TaxID=2560057 RepID=UPI0010738D2C|nr:tetratricopeptide repeat protein [Terasakiella sp. SH-1]